MSEDTQPQPPAEPSSQTEPPQPPADDPDTNTDEGMRWSKPGEPKP
jgi:hypothetical protein